MNKLKIAVLDNGADEKILALCGLPDIIQQNKGNISDEEDLFLHGTNCAMIIGLNCADAELYSYKLLDNTGKGNVDDLKSAFDWCLMNNIRLVNLSFGTTHFKDKGIIRQLVNQYANKGLINVHGSGLTKKELLLLEREKDKLAKQLGGIRNMNRTPSAMFVVDVNKEALAVEEAHKLGIPVVAIVDTTISWQENKRNCYKSSRLLKKWLEIKEI